MIRIFHPNHGYLLVTDDNEKKRLLDTGGYISENFDKLKTKREENEEQTEISSIQSRKNEEVITKHRGRPKKWQ